MAKFSFASLRVRLLLLVLLAVAPLLALVLYSASEYRQREKTKVLENALQLARLASSQQERFIEEGRHLLVGLAQLPELRRRNAVACSKLFADLLKRFPRYANLGATDPNGDIFCSAVPLQRPLNINDRPGIKSAIQSRAFTVGTYQIGLIVGKPVLSLNYPVFDAAGRLQVVLFAMLDLSWLNQFADDAKAPPGSTLILTDRNGMILIHHRDPEKWVGKSMKGTPLFKIIMGQQAEGTAEVVGLDGMPRLYGFTPLRAAAKADAYLAIGIPTQTAFSEVNRIFARNLIWLGLVAFLALVAAWVGGDRFILRPMNALVQATNRLSAGDLSVRSGLTTVHGEIGQLARAFDQMAETLQKREDEAKRAKEALQQYAERLRIQYQIDHAILVAQSPGEIAQSCLDHIRGILPCVRASAVIFNLETSEATVLAVSVNGKTDLGTGEHVPLEMFGDIGQLRQGKIHAVEDMQTLSQITPAIQALQAEGVRSYINVALISRGELIGLLNLGSDRPGTFAPESAEIASGVADSLAVAIQQARLFRSVRENREQLRDLTVRLTEVEEAERRRLARELHDRVGQNLTALGINLNVLREQFSAETAVKVKNLLEDSQELLEETAERIRDVMAELRPPVLDDYGLLAALRWYGKRFSQRTGIETIVQGEEMTPRLSPAIEMALFAIAQEALTNVARHAQAVGVAVTLKGVAKGARLTIADDGVGFDPKVIHRPGERRGWGLITMRERAEAIGGHLQLEGAPGKGTMVVVEVTRNH